MKYVPEYIKKEISKMKKIKQIVLLLCAVLLCLMLFSCAAPENNNIDNASDTHGMSTEIFSHTSLAFESFEEPELIWELQSYIEIPHEIRPYDSTVEYPQEVVNTFISLQKIYEETIEGLYVKIEFFDDTVYMHDYILSRITLRNNTGGDIEYYGMQMGVSGVFIKSENDDSAESQLLARMSSEFVLNGDWADNRVLKNGETFVYESIHFMDHEFFAGGNCYNYLFNITDIGPLENEKKRYSLTFPVEISIAEKH